MITGNQRDGSMSGLPPHGNSCSPCRSGTTKNVVAARRRTCRVLDVTYYRSSAIAGQPTHRHMLKMEMADVEVAFLY